MSQAHEHKKTPNNTNKIKQSCKKQNHRSAQRTLIHRSIDRSIHRSINQPPCTETWPTSWQTTSLGNSWKSFLEKHRKKPQKQGRGIHNCVTEHEVDVYYILVPPFRFGAKRTEHYFRFPYFRSTVHVTSTLYVIWVYSNWMSWLQHSTPDSRFGVF